MGWTPADIPSQTGRRALVTGANSGLGFVTAVRLATAGAEVVLACRNQQKAAAARDRILAGVPGAEVRLAPLDLADLDSVTALADSLLAEGRPLDLLVNNAGLMAVDEARTVQGVEMQWGVNHLGHFALTARLLPLLVRSGRGRVVNVASMGHRAAVGEADPLLERPYRRWQAYFHSKLANLLFTAALHERLVAAYAPVDTVAAHPGGSRTDLGTEGRGVSNLLTRIAVPVVAQSVEHGARPLLRAATDPGVPGGSFVGPRFVVRGRTPVLEVPSARARDVAAARRLWDTSVELAGVDPAAGLA